ncbi:MAG: hypothetical protein ACLQNE_06810 [Thermoguttaceae bacterium]
MFSVKTVALETMVKTTRANGFHGPLELAAGVLRVNNRFVVEKGPAGKWYAIRQSTALVLIGPRCTALVRAA